MYSYLRCAFCWKRVARFRSNNLRDWAASTSAHPERMPSSKRGKESRKDARNPWLCAPFLSCSILGLSLDVSTLMRLFRSSGELPPSIRLVRIQISAARCKSCPIHSVPPRFAPSSSRPPPRRGSSGGRSSFLASWPSLNVLAVAGSTRHAMRADAPTTSIDLGLPLRNT
jgi:hypothetical protein